MALFFYGFVSLLVTLIAIYFLIRVLRSPNAIDTSAGGWGTKIGLVLAMAGNAVGLGNFLRFPVQAISNGGGAFIIPYLVCFLLIGIPLLFVEWSMGRFAGQPYGNRKTGDHNMPFMLQRLAKWPWVKYFGALGLFINIAVAGYYCYIESWTLSYVFHSLIGTFRDLTQTEIAQYFDDYTTRYQGQGGFPYEAIIFYLICLVCNVYILSKGLKGGIEVVAKIGMPLLILFGVILAIQSLSLTAGEKGAIQSGLDGLRFLWTPDYSSIWKPSVWIAAAGQIFFTLAVGMASIQTYASYMKANEDTALSSMSAGWLNEFVEIVIGSAIIIPLTIGYLGIDKMNEIVRSFGGYGLGFKTLPFLFQQWGSFLAAMAGLFWFGLLFIAGITSSLAMTAPVVDFLKNGLKFSAGKSVLVTGLLVFALGIPAILFYNEGVFIEFDDWAGTYALVIFAFVELILFAWVFGMERGWEEITRGAEIKVPLFFKYTIKYITPLFLGWILFSNIPSMIKRIIHPTSTYASFAQFYLLIFLCLLFWMIRKAVLIRRLES
jgi:neurotransmitter:Na+ symporter, NSS family